MFADFHRSLSLATGDIKFPPTGASGQETEEMDPAGREEPLNLSSRTDKPASQPTEANGKIAGTSIATFSCLSPIVFVMACKCCSGYTPYSLYVHKTAACHFRNSSCFR